MLYHFVSVEVLIICPVKNELVVLEIKTRKFNKMQKDPAWWEFIKKDKQYKNKQTNPQLYFNLTGNL